MTTVPVIKAAVDGSKQVQCPCVKGIILWEERRREKRQRQKAETVGVTVIL